MLLRLVAVGKIRESYVAAACGDFSRRLAPYYTLETREIKASALGDPALAAREESQRILRSIGSDDRVWLLDGTGTQFSSVELSRAIQGETHAGARRIVFCIGGAFGSSPALRERADVVWSLSKLTFLHEWARMIVLEQLYRSAKIMRGEPYHH